MKKNYLENILSNFEINGDLQGEVEAKTNGNINKTFIGTYKQESGEEIKVLLQKINTGVFLEPHKLMKNINQVTEFIAKRLTEEGDHTHKPLMVIKTKDDHYLYTVRNHAGENDYYRVYNYIDGAVSYDNVKDPKIVENAGRAFGHFQRMLVGYPGYIEETIPNFHNTPERYRRFMKDVRTDAYNRVDSVAKEILFVIKRKEDCSLIVDKIKEGTIPTRIIHNDTKVNNVLFDAKTKEFLTVIDLDTVMPGYVGYDFGDGIRSAAAYVKEDEPCLSKVGLDMNLFKAFTDGYLSEVSHFLAPDEIKLLGKSIKLITLELGMRFLNDYINGDTYFKTDYAEHNLVRARNQLALVSDIESKEEEIEEYIQKVYKKNR